MNLFEQKPIKSLRMDNESGALEMIDEFFHIFHLFEAQEELTILRQTALNDPRFSSKEKSEDLDYFCEKLRELIEAAHQLKK